MKKEQMKEQIIELVNNVDERRLRLVWHYVRALFGVSK